eukprot:TRINITY_DN24406_c0_g1_i1.p1 TRINITY_DN24406_c0_g1~~TRINITY_DN24406_c0_g1_i1.p1  ORF type:complete len:176 (+),score=25.41 TRINITY_DN24406_c0_g1_i1:112-639(+)
MKVYYILLLILGIVVALLVLYPPVKWVYRKLHALINPVEEVEPPRKSSNMSLSSAPAVLKRDSSTGRKASRTLSISTEGRRESRVDYVSFGSNLLTPSVTFLNVDSPPLPPVTRLSSSVLQQVPSVRSPLTASARSPLTGASIVSYALGGEQEENTPYLERLISSGDDNFSNLSY